MLSLGVHGEIAYLSLESRYHCRCRHFSTCWSSPSEPWSAGGWRCPGGWCPRPPQGYSPGWSVHPFELQESTFKVKNTTSTVKLTQCLIFDKKLESMGLMQEVIYKHFSSYSWSKISSCFVSTYGFLGFINFALHLGHRNVWEWSRALLPR